MLAAILQDADLPVRPHSAMAWPAKADRVDVLDLAARAEIAAGPAHRHVDVGAQDALFHVAVARAEIAQDGAHLGQI